MSDVSKEDDDWAIARLQIYRDESIKASASMLYNLMVAVFTTGIIAPLVSWLLGASDANRAAGSGLLLYLPVVSLLMVALLHVFAEKTLEALKE